MNKHTKLAIFVAPFLAVGGYILSDMYVENQAQELRIFNLKQEGNCNVIAKDCVLSAGDFKINVYDENGVTFINATYPLDKATLFLVDKNNQATSYPLAIKENAYYWGQNTPLSQSSDSKQKVRLIAQIKGGQYISEFYTSNQL